MKQFYKLMSCINVQKSNDQLMDMYVSGVRYYFKGELIMHFLYTLEEAHQSTQGRGKAKMEHIQKK